MSEHTWTSCMWMCLLTGRGVSLRLCAWVAVVHVIASLSLFFHVLECSIIMFVYALTSMCVCKCICVCVWWFPWFPWKANDLWMNFMSSGPLHFKADVTRSIITVFLEVLLLPNIHQLYKCSGWRSSEQALFLSYALLSQVRVLRGKRDSTANNR